MNIQQEFSCNYPNLVYIEHKYLENSQIGIAYAFMYDRCIAGGVKVFNIKDGRVQWKNAVRTCCSWAEVKSKVR